MKPRCRDIFVVSLLCFASFLQPGLGGEVAVKGGSLKDPAGREAVSVSSFFMSRLRTTRDEWQTVQEWAAQNGYQIRSLQSGDPGSHAAKNMSWYDAVKWCNAKSQMEGLSPVYTVSGATYKNMSGYNANGKVGEWCWDFAEPQYSTRRIRDGSWWNFIAVGFTASYPIYNFPNYSRHGLGFRTVRRNH